MTLTITKACNTYSKNYLILVSLRWIINGDVNRHFCLTAESMSNDNKLQSYIGDCCQFPKLIWKTNGEIWDFDNNVCLGETKDDSDVKFKEDCKSMNNLF